MPNVNTKTLRGNRAIAGVVEYLLDEAHPNHLAHAIHATPGQESGEAMAARIAYGLQVLNRERSGSNQIRVRGWLAMVTFPDGTDLSSGERNQVEQTFLEAFDLPETTPRAWHVNWLTKGSDFNFVIGRVLDTAVPLLRRWAHVSLRARLIEIADAVTTVLNETRALLGRGLIQTMAAVQRQQATERRGDSLEALIAHSSMATSVPISKATLPTLLAHAGYSTGSWDCDDDHLWIQLGYLRRRRTKLRLQTLLTDSQAIAEQRSRTAQEVRTKIHAAVDAADKGRTQLMQAPAVSDKRRTPLNSPL